MKIAFLVLSLMSFSAFAQTTCDSLSSHCMRALSGYMPRGEAAQFCNNVANTCFANFLKSDGFYGAREKCVNVSSRCFDEVQELHAKELAAEACSNVSNLCFIGSRNSGYSLKESIRKCSDISVPCRICH